MRDYLEDLLAEPLREEMRGHLDRCAACRNYMLEFGSFASDLRRMARAGLPFDLAGGLKKQLEAGREGKKFFPFLFSLRLLKFTFAAAAFAAFLLAVNWGRFYFSAKWGEKIEPSPILPILQPAAPALSPYAGLAVRELQNIDHRLSRITESGSRAATVPTPLASSITLRPFHWHLAFDTLDQRDSFARQILSLASQVSFQIPECLVLDTNRQELEKLIFLIENSGGLTWKGKKIEREKLSGFQGPLRVSLILEAPSPGKSPARFIHWHFHFSLPNRFVLLESLKGQKIQFVYEAPELWALWVSPEEFLKLKEEIRSFHGLSVQYPDEDSRLEDISGWGGARLVIYIEEG